MSETDDKAFMVILIKALYVLIFEEELDEAEWLRKRAHLKGIMDKYLEKEWTA